MHVIIPVAGEGTRLRPHTYSIPKVLLPVAGKPILSHILDEVAKLSPDKVTLIIGHLGGSIKSYLKGNYDLNFNWIVQEERRGLGHAVGMGITEHDHEPLLIILGDTIFEADLSIIGESAISSIGVKEVDDPRRFGVVEMENDLVVRMVEKPEVPPSNLAIVGLYYITDAGKLGRAVRRLVEEDIQTKGEYQLTDALQLMVEGGEKLTTFRVDGWYDCGKPETLLETNAHFLSKLSTGADSPGNCLVGPVFLSPAATVEHSVIGPNVSISGGVRVERSVIRNSILCEGARVNNVVLEDSIIGPEAVVKGRSSSLNLGELSQVKLDHVSG
jgi:glucose-1-phosphate thymidylyltransferase